MSFAPAEILLLMAAVLLLHAIARMLSKY